MLTCTFHPDTVKLMETDEFHQLDTRFFRRIMKGPGFKVVHKDEEILITASNMTCQDNIIHVPILGKMGYTFRRIKLNGITQVVVC